MDRRKFLTNLTLGVIGTSTLGSAIFLNGQKPKFHHENLLHYFQNSGNQSSLRIMITSQPVSDWNRLSALALFAQRVRSEVMVGNPDTVVLINGIGQGIAKKTDLARYYYLISPKGEMLVSQSLLSPYPLTIGGHFSLSEVKITIRGRSYKPRHAPSIFRNT